MEASDLLRADDLFARSSKLAGQPQMVEIFQAIGLGQWFRYVTGVIEAGSALLLVPSLAFFGAIALADDGRRRHHASVRD
jgi:hypothetical protein